MKTLFLFLVALVVIVSFGCESIFSDNEKDLIDIGWINDRDSLNNFPESIQNGSEINLQQNVLWSDGCVYRSYFEVERENDFTYKFTLKDARKGQLCTLDIRQATTTFKFKPEKKGSYTLKFIDRNGTRTKTLVVE